MWRGSVTPSIAEVVMRLREQLRTFDRVEGEICQTLLSSGVDADDAEEVVGVMGL